MSSNGACDGRRNATGGFNRFGNRIVVPDTCTSQKRGFCPRCCSGHNWGQLWTRERSASIHSFQLTCANSLNHTALVLVGFYLDNVQSHASVLLCRCQHVVVVLYQIWTLYCPLVVSDQSACDQWEIRI